MAESYEIPVLVLGFYPDEDGDGLLDRDIVGPETGNRPVSVIKAKTDRFTADIVQVLESGSTFHGYKDPNAIASLHYRILDFIKFDDPVPLSAEFPPFADHIKVLNDIDICDYVQKKGVKEVWIWMYHADEVNCPDCTNFTVPIESNMSGPWGDISNSFRQDDLPHCGKTYTVYNYNYGRELSTMVENHMHQIEHVLNFVDGRDTTPADQWGSLLFWGNFVGSDISHTIIKPGCGWTHYPPNGETDYDWTNRDFVESDCEDWKPDGTGQTQVFNCEKWNCYSVQFFEWWMQNLPGSGNDLYFDGRKLKNWWSFIGDFDAAMTAGKSLVWPEGEAVGGSVRGVVPRRIVCQNRTIVQRVGVALPDDSSWNCEAAGLTVSQDDKIRQIAIGTADGTRPVGGAVTGVDANRVRCINLSRDRRVYLHLKRGNTKWNCEAAGLRVRTGDKIRQEVQGAAE